MIIEFASSRLSHTGSVFFCHRNYNLINFRDRDYLKQFQTNWHDFLPSHMRQL